MAGGQGEKLIFDRYTREECGLPPAGAKLCRGGLTPGRAAAVLVAIGIIGLLVGLGAARRREHWLAALPARVAAAPLADIPNLLARGRLYVSALPDNRRMRRDLAFACLAAAEKSPRRLGYYANAARIFRDLDAVSVAAPDREAFAASLTAAGAYAELESYPEAFAALDRAEAGLEHIGDAETERSFRLMLVNAQAYFLAVADSEQGGDPARALRLARLMISSRDPLPGGGHASGQAAFLDTLATAWNRNGDAAQAAATQRLALGLADAPGLDVYLRHYDEFVANPATSAP